MKKITTYLFIITILYFVLGTVNILFAWLGLLCMAIPFVLLFKNRKKTWCQKYCPRSQLFMKTGRIKKPTRSTPKLLTKGRLKWFVLGFFVFSMSLIVYNAVMVSLGNQPASHSLTFLLFLKLPFTLPQFISITGPSDWVYDFGYRMYSLMMTTTVIGLLLAFVYKPRTWCVICPIATVSDLCIKKR